VRFVISTAATQAAIGAHYINGSDGGITGMNAVGEAGGGLSASRKIYLLEDYSWSKLAVHSAIYGGRVCKGRYDAVGGKKIPSGTTDLTTLKDVYVPSLASADSRNRETIRRNNALSATRPKQARRHDLSCGKIAETNDISIASRSLTGS
jgi:hypothetical protein